MDADRKEYNEREREREIEIDIQREAEIERVILGLYEGNYSRY